MPLDPELARNLDAATRRPDLVERLEAAADRLEEIVQVYQSEAIFPTILRMVEDARAEHVRKGGK